MALTSVSVAEGSIQEADENLRCCRRDRENCSLIVSGRCREQHWRHKGSGRLMKRAQPLCDLFAATL